MLVIGAGPSGLSAAYHLARLGHEVEIRDAGAEPGGMMRYGIPAYRLPRDVLDGEIDRIAALGVRIDLRPPGRGPRRRAATRAASTRSSSRSARTCPSGSTSRPGTPGAIVDAVSFLRSVASGERPVIGRRVAVYGGGNTAMDAARVARRLGADEALIVYRRTREQMPAHEEEAEDAEREGVRINWLRTITAFDGPELQVEVMELDESGYPAADRAVRDARRRHRDPGARPGDRHRASCARCRASSSSATAPCRCRPSLMTGCPGVFAGGDMVPSERTVTVGVGHGKKAARHIDAWLRGAARPSAAEARRWRRSTSCNLWYFGDAARRQQPELAPAERVAGLRRGGRRPVRRARRPTRRAAACRAATASSATAASARAPRTR